MRKGSERERYSECWEVFIAAIWKINDRSRECLSGYGYGYGSPCSEAELRKDIPNICVKLDAKLAFGMPGPTYKDEDCKDALAILKRRCHGRRTVFEGDVETYRLIANLTSSMPWHYE